MWKEVETTVILERKRFCDVEGCNDPATELNGKYAKDYCYLHAKKKHQCEFIEKYTLKPTYQDLYWVLEKETNCLEADTICENRYQSSSKYLEKYCRQTYHFYKKEDFYKFVFNMFEESHWLKDGFDNYGDKELIDTKEEKEKANKKFIKLLK